MPTVGAVVKAVAAAGGIAEVLELMARVHAWISKRAKTERLADEAKALLGLTKDFAVSYRHDSVHPLYTKSTQLHPDNLAALVALISNDFIRAMQLERVRLADSVSSTLDDNLVLIGSPASEALSRLVFGYEPGADGDSLVLRKPPLDLPMRWILDRDRIHGDATAKRYVSGKGLVARPNWRIEGGKRILIPEVDYAGILSVDYLLVTRVRNYLSPAALDRGRYIMSFGGTHGTATRALELLLRDTATLSHVADRLRRQPAAYQLLFRVGGMKHHPRHGTAATTIELVGEPIVLPDDPQAWRAACRTAQKGLKTWFADHNATTSVPSAEGL